MSFEECITLENSDVQVIIIKKNDSLSGNDAYLEAEVLISDYRTR